MERKLCSLNQFHELLALLQGGGYRLLGPMVRNEAIVYGDLQSAQDLPIGWMDEQGPGYYRLKRRTDGAYFGYNLGAHTWKQFLFPPKETLFTAKRQDNGLVVFQEGALPVEKMAFIGVRACEIKAMLIQDLAFNHKLAVYQQYVQRRKSTFILAVNCTRSVSTCFCPSMDAGPKVEMGFDLSLTEVIGDDHYFLLEIGSERGRAMCDPLQLQDAQEGHCEMANALIERNREQMVRHVDAKGVHGMLTKSYSCKRWDEVARRCINCANCTSVCPTCFCSDSADVLSLDGAQVERVQTWDSCFNLSHSMMHGGPVRGSAQSRYRQWLTHKFGTWWDQFGVSGCVGCGRCITWCPVGIDVTEELHELQKESPP